MRRLLVIFFMSIFLTLAIFTSQAVPAQGRSSEISSGVSPVDASLSHQCGQDSAGGVSYSWCIDTPTTHANQDVVFYLHGLEGNSASFISRYPKLEPALQAKGAAPTVLTVSFGPIWFLTDEATPIHPALHQVFVSQIIPQMEARLKRPIRNRLIMGESMGGLNASELFLKNGNLFSRAVILCPAMSILTPFASDQDLQAFLATRPYVQAQLVGESRTISQAEFPTPTIWKADDPLELVTKLSPSAAPVYISSGTHDEWGFYDGAAQFAHLATQQKAPVTWVSIPNVGHCVQTDSSNAQIVSFISEGMSSAQK
jgi:pimeloyl-ACP methyl ester carboxylesterase